MSNTSTAVAQRTDLKSLLAQDKYKGRIAELLKDRAPQFGAALVQVVGRSYSLQKCQPDSVIGAAITAACLDLSLDPNLGEAHLVPYGDKCQFQLGYKGLTQLGLRSGQYKRLGWAVIREGELLEWNELTGDLKLDSEKMRDETRESRDIIGYAAYFALINGFERASYWTKEKVEKHAMRYSQAFKAKKQDSPWFSTFDIMALKTVLKDLLSHWGPKSVQMQTAMARDQQVFTDVETGSYLDNDDVPDPEVKKPLFQKKTTGEDVPPAPPKNTHKIALAVKLGDFTFDDLLKVCDEHPQFGHKAGLWTQLDDVSEPDAEALVKLIEIKEGVLTLR